MTNIYPGIGWSSSHHEVPVKHPSGAEIPIDEEIAELMSLVWARGIVTTTSCQEHWDGYVLIGFNSAGDAEAFIQALALKGSEEEMSNWWEPPPLGEKRPLFRRVAGIEVNELAEEDEEPLLEGEWRWLIWFQPHEQVRPDFKMRVELRFPRSDLVEVTERIAGGEEV